MNAFQVLENLVPSERKNIDSIQFEITRKPEGKRIIKKISVNDSGKLMEFQERVELLDEDDFLKLAHWSGFHVVHKFGSYSLDTFNYKVSDRLIMIFQKNA